MNYIDLGLPSGTLWADTNEDGYYTFEEAVKKYGDRLPTKEQLEELEYKCQWEWIGSECKVTGPNGNSMILPASGYRYSDGNVGGVGSVGYWSSTPYDSDDAWFLYFDSSGAYVYLDKRCFGFSVRLVK